MHRILTSPDRLARGLFPQRCSVTGMCVSRNTWPSTQSHAVHRGKQRNCSRQRPWNTRRSITHRCKHTRSSSLRPGPTLVHRCMPPLPAANVTLSPLTPDMPRLQLFLCFLGGCRETAATDSRVLPPSSTYTAFYGRLRPVLHPRRLINRSDQ